MGCDATISSDTRCQLERWEHGGPRRRWRMKRRREDEGRGGRRAVLAGVRGDVEVAVGGKHVQRLDLRAKQRK